MDSFLDKSLREFVTLAASDAPTPGGGAIAALVGALGGAMASMAANFTAGKPKFAQHEAAVQKILATLTPLIEAMQQDIDADAAAFSKISAAYALPKSTDTEKAARKQAVDAALRGAMLAPLALAKRTEQAADTLPELARIGNPNLLSDVVVAAIMLAAAARAARVNVRVNAKFISEGGAGEAAAAVAESDRIMGKTRDIADEVEQIVAAR